MFGDQILNTETINESLSNRQSAKMMFLQKENEQLISENEDLKDALKLNKEALRIAYQCSFGKNSGNTNITGSKVQGQKMDYSADDFTIKLTQENEKLLGMLSKMSKERNKAQSVALLQEQIGQESSNFLQEQLAEREEKIKELRMLIQEKEFVIQEFEKSKGYYDYSQNVLIRIREITTPNDQSMKLHTEIEHLRTLIAKISEENHRLNTRILLKEEHFRMMKQEVLKLRMVILNPINYQKMRGFIMRNYSEKGDEDAFMCGAFYKEVEQQQTEETNLQQEKEQKEKLLQYQKELIEKQHTPLRPTRVVGIFPSAKNQMTSQNQGMNTQSSLLTQGNQLLTMPFTSGNLQIDKLTEKIAKLEENLKKMSKLHKKEVENNNILVSKIEEILRECDTCFNNNELLISSNLAFQSQIEDLRNQIIHFKAFQGKYFQLIRNHRKRYASACFMDTPTEQQLDEDLKRKGIIGKEKEKTTANNLPEMQKEVNVSILEEAGEEEAKQKNLLSNNNNYSSHRQYWCDIRYDLAEKRSKVNTGQDEANNLLKDLDSDIPLTKDQAKIYILNLAKDLYMNTSIKSAGLTRQVLKQIEIGGYKTGIVNLFRNKRCLSNPLDYICEENVQLKNNLNNDHNNHTNDWNEVLRRNRIKQAQQNALQQQFGIDNQGEKESKDQHHNNILFNVDMSVIMNAQQRFGKSKEEAKKFQKIQVDSSFISNDGDVQELP